MSLEQLSHVPWSLSSRNEHEIMGQADRDNSMSEAVFVWHVSRTPRRVPRCGRHVSKTCLNIFVLQMRDTGTSSQNACEYFKVNYLSLILQLIIGLISQSTNEGKGTHKK